MERVSKIVTRVTRTVEVTLDEEQIATILKEACGFSQSAKVEWDCGEYCVRNVIVTNITVEEEENA